MAGGERGAVIWKSVVVVETVVDEFTVRKANGKLSEDRAGATVERDFPNAGTTFASRPIYLFIFFARFVVECMNSISIGSNSSRCSRCAL